MSGLFVTGVDTGVGKTYVACLIARQLAAGGRSVGVYKPAASGCRREEGELVCDDAQQLWEAAGRPGELCRVCPQRFAAPLSPPRAAQQEGRTVDRGLLREGLDFWLRGRDILVVEGAGGLLSPISGQDLVADVAGEFGFPLVIVARNAIGAINQTLQTLLAAHAYREPIPVAAVVLNDATTEQNDPSRETNFDDLRQFCNVPVLTRVAHDAQDFHPPVNWFRLAAEATDHV